MTIYIPTSLLSLDIYPQFVIGGGQGLNQSKTFISRRSSSRTRTSQDHEINCCAILQILLNLIATN